MPHIKSVRLVNVHFNNATQFYDDFRMKFEGKNATYDLENGGGKSLMLLMILQTVLPKTYLRREKPVSLIFQGGKDRTSHVAVEWILEEGSQYKYLMTGFSARKKKGASAASPADKSEEEDNLLAGDIEHINWCVFYNDTRITGIQSAPLSKEESGRKIYSSFDDVRRYIQQMKQKGLPADVFDGIDKYQSYISASNLIPAEWNIIRGINSGENNIESYFRQNTTSRKLIENQFIKIIEDIEALNKEGKGGDESLLLADTLIEIRSRLNEYLKLKEHLAEFEKIKEYFSEFGNRNEELYEAFKSYESYRDEAAGIRNLIRSKLDRLDKDIAAITGRIEDNARAAREGSNLKKLLEAGLVKYKMDKLIFDKEKSEAEEAALRDELKALEDKYNDLNALVEYGEYRVTKGKLHEKEVSLQGLAKDQDELSARYRESGGCLKYLLSKELKSLQQLYDEEKEKAHRIEAEIKVNQEELLAETRQESVVDSVLATLEKRDSTISDEISRLQGFFMERGEIDALMNSQSFLSSTQDLRSKQEELKDKLTERMAEIDMQIQALDLRLMEIKGEIKSKEQAKAWNEEWLNGFWREQAIFQGKAEGFGEKDISGYRDELELLIHAESLKKLEQEIESGRLRQKRALSEERGYYVPNEEILSLARLLGEKCEFVKAGIDWIADAKQEEKEALIEDLPYLPFSIIVDDKSLEKMKNGRIKIDYSSDYSIPVVSVNTIKARKNSTSNEVYFYCSFFDLVLDPKLYKQYIDGMDLQLDSLERGIKSGESRIQRLSLDLRAVNSFMDIYSQEKVDEARKNLLSINNDIEFLNSSMKDILKKRAQLSEEKAAAAKQTEELAASIKDLIHKEENLNAYIKYNDELSGIRSEISSKKKELELVKNKIKTVEYKIAELDRKNKWSREQLYSLDRQLYSVQLEKEAVESFDEVENNIALDEARAEFKALSDAVSGRMASETRLRNDIEEHRKLLNKLKEQVWKYHGRDLEKIEAMDSADSRIVIPTQVSIDAAKKEWDESKKNLQILEKKIQDISNKISGAAGKLEVILQDVSDEEKQKLPVYDSEEQYAEEIKYTEQIIKAYNDEVNTLNNDLDQIKHEHGKAANQLEFYDSFIEREGIGDIEYIAAEIRDFRQFENEYLSIYKRIDFIHEKWLNRIKSIQEESKDFVIREPLMELSEISRPESAAQCRIRRDAFNEYLMNIDEQMQKINNDIMQLESYQQDFTRRCVQRAELVLGHIKKLESLSRIEVYGRKINMIELKLHEFEDKEKYLRMKAHIDSIVREISDDGAVDRKRIATQLSTKELIARISDMDKASVRLYKVESIPENSRYYRWENAIGSEGQNNSLYFIFAACLISFIRMLSITNSSPKTKKVIIADNPFGATSAVYLWDPMFRILKQNDIQLIAPGHRIPREITANFGVSYILNQDILQDGRMRVVVKDVRVEEDEDVIKYVDPEQLTLF